MPSKPTSLTAARVCHELLLCVRILVDQVVKSGAVMLSVFMIYFPRLTLASILVARREAGTRVFLCVIVPLKKIPVFFVDTRSPSPRLYRLITHKFQGHQVSHQFREDPRHRPTAVCPPHHKTTQDRTRQGHSPQNGVVGRTRIIY